MFARRMGLLVNKRQRDFGTDFLCYVESPADAEDGPYGLGRSGAGHLLKRQSILNFLGETTYPAAQAILFAQYRRLRVPTPPDTANQAVRPIAKETVNFVFVQGVSKSLACARAPEEPWSSLLLGNGPGSPRRPMEVGATHSNLPTDWDAR